MGISKKKGKQTKRIFIFRYIIYSINIKMPVNAIQYVFIH
jgi:hypothetical protein